MLSISSIDCDIQVELGDAINCTVVVLDKVDQPLLVSQFMEYFNCVPGCHM